MRRSFLLCLAFGLVACQAVPDHAERQSQADQIAARAHLEALSVTASPFTLTGYQRIHHPHAPITVYIEGDGYAWAAPDMASDDPTPLQPIGLELAANDLAPNILYLARPCQYHDDHTPECDRRYWTNARFSPVVIHAFDRALTQIKATTGTKGFHLVGFSGGGAVALLLASQRSDILSVRTVAGNLDHRAWTSLHAISPLDASLNPADDADRLSTVPQLHFVGEADDIMPPAIAASYRSHFKNPRCIHIVSVADVTHTLHWETQWPALSALPVTCDP